MKLLERRARITAVLRPKNIVFRRAHLATLNSHAIDTVLKYDIEVIANPSTSVNGFADFEKRAIWVRPVTNAETYHTCLHEVAHIVSPDADSRQFAYQYREIGKSMCMLSALGELGAWNWVTEHALGGVTAAMAQQVYDALAHVVELTNATRVERESIVLFVRSMTFRVQDNPGTFGELENKCAAIMGDFREREHRAALSMSA